MDLYKKAVITAVSFGLLSVIILLTSFAFNQIENVEMLENLVYSEEVAEGELVEFIYIGETSRQEDSVGIGVMPVYNGKDVQTTIYPTSTTKTRRVPERYKVVIFHNDAFLELDDRDLYYYIVKNDLEKGSKLKLIFEVGKNQENEIIVKNLKKIIGKEEQDLTL